MGEWTTVGRMLIVIGLGVTALGLLVSAADKFPGLSQGWSWFGRLPGDISIKKDNVSFYFPITTSLFVSIVLSLVFVILSWLFRR